MPSGVAWFTKNDRASGRASASYVMTLMPLLCALRSAVEMPSRFSHAAAITSTPSAIQFSTISFCFAGSLSVGPSNNRSMPSAFAAFSAPALHEMK